MNVLTLLLFGTGAVMIYSGFKDLDPRDVLRDSLKASRKNEKAVKPSKTPTPEPPDGPRQANV